MKRHSDSLLHLCSVIVRVLIAFGLGLPLGYAFFSWNQSFIPLLLVIAIAAALECFIVFAMITSHVKKTWNSRIYAILLLPLGIGAIPTFLFLTQLIPTGGLLFMPCIPLVIGFAFQYALKGGKIRVEAALAGWLGITIPVLWSCYNTMCVGPHITEESTSLFQLFVFLMIAAFLFVVAGGLIGSGLRTQLLEPGRVQIQTQS